MKTMFLSPLSLVYKFPVPYLDNMARKTQTTFTRALGYAAVSHALAKTCSGAIFVWNLTLGKYFQLTASFFFIYMVL